MKTCSNCKNIKSASEFYKDKRASDGLFSSCKGCTLERQKGYKPPESARQKKLKAKRLWYQECGKEYFSDYRAKNRQTINSQSNAYRKKNLSKYAKYRSDYRARQLSASPCWLSKEQVVEIEHFYNLAKDVSVVTGEPYEVDHIVPLQGRDICGLHVPWNLQVLPQDLNRKKSNEFKGYN